MKVFMFIFLAHITCLRSEGQAKLNLRFQSDTIKSKSDSHTTVNEQTQFEVLNAKTCKDCRVKIEIDKAKTTANLNSLRLPLVSEFVLDGGKDTLQFQYKFSVERDKEDDKALAFRLLATDQDGQNVQVENDKVQIVYLKPQIPDSLKNSETLEFWFFVGTNFDVFDGVKPQELFFRSNTLLKVSRRFFAQVGFYKSRYFSLDSSANPTIVRRDELRSPDSTYTVGFGKYHRVTKQTVDPIGLQLDAFFKLTRTPLGNNSNFFATLGIDFSTRTTITENSFSDFDTVQIKVYNRDSLYRGSFGELPAEKTSFQNRVYNFNAGLLWVFDDSEVNVKAHIVGGLSNFTNLYLIVPLTGTKFYKSSRKPYMQFRMFATYKPIGVSFGFESFIRRSDVPQFNFTLSKVIDLRHFLSVLAPVSSLTASK